MFIEGCSFSRGWGVSEDGCGIEESYGLYDLAFRVLAIIQRIKEKTHPIKLILLVYI